MDNVFIYINIQHSELSQRANQRGKPHIQYSVGDSILILRKAPLKDSRHNNTALVAIRDAQNESICNYLHVHTFEAIIEEIDNVTSEMILKHRITRDTIMGKQLWKAVNDKTKKECGWLYTDEWMTRENLELIFLKFQLQALELFAVETAQQLSILPFLIVNGELPYFFKEMIKTEEHQDFVNTLKKIQEQNLYDVDESKETDQIGENSNNNSNTNSNRKQWNKNWNKNKEKEKEKKANDDTDDEMDDDVLDLGEEAKQLNESQAKAICKATLLPITLIQGPPGTGKTVTASMIIKYIIQTTQRGKTRDLIVVSGNTHASVEQLQTNVIKFQAVCDESRMARLGAVWNMSPPVCVLDLALKHCCFCCFFFIFFFDQL